MLTQYSRYEPWISSWLTNGHPWPGLIKNHFKCFQLATGGQTSVPSPSKTFYIPSAVFLKAPRPLGLKCWPSNHCFLSFVQLVSISNIASEKHLARFNSVSQSKITFPVICRRAWKVPQPWMACLALQGSESEEGRSLPVPDLKPTRI